ncbi:peptidoglycan DD-metalloendopeptidase family protein [Caenibius sp. WL]|uniref:peptidoglycan DD-metalloendopeptidase family protein n=1 Tax=Caenibius sp. WL TaxID=2872646 RepID=UPI0021BDE172|nr:peptidoglycan DD-metalloendopeptidase family protein [Caenibius sp. WL]
MANHISGGLGTRLAAWFPDREFFVRSKGQVRFITVSSRVQIAAAALVLAAVLLWIGVMAAVTSGHFLSRAEQNALNRREAQVSQAEDSVSHYRNELKAAAESLRRRQDFLEEMVESLPADAKLESEALHGTAEAAAAEDKTLAKISAILPEAAALARIEARQLAFAERLTRLANRRADSAAAGIRKLGLNPRQMTDDVEEARGGPLEMLSTENNGSLHPRFEQLGLALARMDALERGLAGIPQVLPASLSMISSGFGYRRDPFNAHPAMHSGLDFRGPTGSPIYATAPGKITFRGVQNGYGNTVEISHGNGLVTRYAHMSAFRARLGQEVDAGDIIGAIGSTGRSTGPHLHFEVLINGRAVNPRPFLEAAPHVLKEVRNRTAAERSPPRAAR